MVKPQEQFDKWISTLPSDEGNRQITYWQQEIEKSYDNGKLAVLNKLLDKACNAGFSYEQYDIIKDIEAEIELVEKGGKVAR